MLTREKKYFFTQKRYSITSIRNHHYIRRHNVLRLCLPEKIKDSHSERYDSRPKHFNPDTPIIKFKAKGCSNKKQKL